MTTLSYSWATWNISCYILSPLRASETLYVHIFFCKESQHFAVKKHHLDTLPDGEGEGDEYEEKRDDGEDKVHRTALLLLGLFVLGSILALAVHRRWPHLRHLWFGHLRYSVTAEGYITGDRLQAARQ